MFASRCPPAFFRRTAITLKTNMLTAKAKSPRPWAFRETYENLRKTFIFHGSALLGGMLRRAFFVIVRFWAPCGRRLGALWRLWGALCRLWGPLWRLWVATWRPKARPGTPCTLRSRATAGRVTRFWGPKALFREPKVDGQGPNAIGHGLSAKYTKTIGKLCFFMVRRCSGACFAEFFW